MTPEVFSVLVVDDADDVRAVVKTQLTLNGRFRVVAEGGTGREAVELATRHQPHVVVLDASMPDMDGLHAITRIRNGAPTTKIVMLSGFEGANLRDTAIGLGAADYIEKSAPLRELPDRLLELLGADPAHVEAPHDADVGDAAEEVLAAHLERFRTVFDQAAIGMATLTLSGTLVRANRALVALLGGDERAVVGRPLAEFAHPADRDAVTEALLAAAGDQAARELEHRLGSGEPQRWAQTSFASVRDAGDRPLYLFAQLEDVTAGHEARERLRESEERFRLMVESVQDYAIFMLDRDGLVSTWNLGAQRLKGYTADEIIGRHFRTFYPDPARAAKHPEYELEVAVREGRYEEEGWRVRKDGTRFWANVVITALFDRDRRHVGFAKVTRDMTERRAAEAQRASAAARLAASNEELHESARQTEEFLAVTAHELQSPVAAITGAAEILLDYWDKLPAGERVDTIKRIRAGGDRIRRLLDDLLTASQLEAGKLSLTLERVAMDHIIAAALSEIGAVRAEVSGAENVHVLADTARLVQVLTNLLTNAVKYGEPPFGVGVSVKGDNVEIHVSDKGEGPPEDLRPRLFEKFAKATRAKAQGTGLGLFIVRELARMQDGDAWYEDGPAFVVRLPRA